MTPATTSERQVHEAVRVTSPEAFQEALALRYEVFCDEQRVPRELENDAEDAFAVHVLVRDAEGRVCATGRLLRMSTTGVLMAPDAAGADTDLARIGRMAVRRDVRRGGLGRIVLSALEREASGLGMKAAVLHAQLQAEPFYASAGYVRYGAEFDEAGIPHVEMRKTLDQSFARR